MIGMGRALSDGVSDAYIQDVMVLREFRKRGAGKRIIAEIVRCLMRLGVDWIGLIAEPGSLAFYRGLGFRPMPRCTPMRWRGR
jgi:spermidine synthase